MCERRVRERRRSSAVVGKECTTDCVDINDGRIIISAEIAVKNNECWENQLSGRSETVLKKFIEQRKNYSKYDGNDHIWLNRKGNPYCSKTLNDLLDGLLDDADITQDARKITWHSIRHSTGMYVYDQRGDLGAVADLLRHASVSSARQYAHPTPESQKQLVESLQKGDF